MKIGQTVYTVNAKTNKVDEWTLDSVLKSKKHKPLLVLTDGKHTGVFPHNAVYPTRARALEIAKL